VKRWVTTLLFMLLIQCGLLTAVYWPAQSQTPATAAQQLAGFDSAAIDQIRIGDGYDNEAVLVKAGDRWLLSNLENLPAAAKKIDALLLSFTHQASGWPVAHSTAARRRFEVADQYYQRQLTLLSQDTEIGTIYLGSSPGFRKVHARSQGQDAIFSIPFNTFDAPAISGPWVEPTLLQVRAPLRIYADTYSLNLENGSWLSGAGEAPDEQELQVLINALRTLQVEGVAQADQQRDLSSAEADLILQINSLSGEVFLELFTLNDKHFIFSSAYPLFFKLSAYDFDRLTQIDIGLISTGATAQ
jgi:hypothetical protein